MSRDTTAHTLAAPLEVCRWQKNKWTELKPPLPSVTGATEVRVEELQVSANGKSVHVLGTVLFGVSSGRASMSSLHQTKLLGGAHGGWMPAAALARWKHMGWARGPVAGRFGCIHADCGWAKGRERLLTLAPKSV